MVFLTVHINVFSLVRAGTSLILLLIMQSLYRSDSYLKIHLPAFQKACYTSCFTYYHFPFSHLAVFSLSLGSAVHLSLTVGKCLQPRSSLLTQSSEEWDS